MMIIKNELPCIKAVLSFFHRMLYAVVFALLATSTLAACKCQRPVFSTISQMCVQELYQQLQSSLSYADANACFVFVTFGRGN